MDPLEILKTAGGVLLRRDVLAAGATEVGLRRAVREGQILKLDRHRLPLTHEPRYRTLAALPDVLLHALLCLPELESLVMVECACNRGDVDPAYLYRHLDGRRCGTARNVLAKVERGADSLLETLASAGPSRASVLLRRRGSCT